MEASEGSANKVLILIASARLNGNTALAVDRLQANLSPLPTTKIDVSALNLRRFDYQRAPEDDGFRDVIGRVAAHQHLVLATPVYWYAMSGPMKIFFDRLTDLLLDPAAHPLGRALAGRHLWVLATGTDELPPLGFDEPFARTAAYFSMRWRGTCYVRLLDGAAPTAEEFRQADSLSAALAAEVVGNG